MNYDYKNLYNEAWAGTMEEVSDIFCVGITRYDADDQKIFGFTNVYAECQSPYDFCARLGLEVLINLSREGVESLKAVKGSYMLGYKSE